MQKPRTSFLPNVQQQYYKKDLVFNVRMGKERLFDVNFTPTFGFKTFSVTSVVKFWGHESIWPWSRFLQTRQTIILENKVFQKSKLSKNAKNKICTYILLYWYFLMKKIRKILIFLTLTLQLFSIHIEDDQCESQSKFFFTTDFWAKIYDIYSQLNLSLRSR